MRKSREDREDYETGTDGDKPKRTMLLVRNNPYAPRICPELAEEIGLNESILLLQIDFWISVSSSEEHEGRRWTFQSVRDIQKTFPFWSLATINRTIQSLIDSKYVLVGNFNAYKYDKTRWFALNFEKIKQLTSIHIAEGGSETGVYQNGTRSTQNDTRSTQNDTTIPETSTEISSEIPTNVVVAPLAQDNYDHRAEKALQKAKAKPKPQPAPALETEFGAQFAAYEKEFFPIGNMSPSESVKFGELWDELTGPPASIPPDKVARTFDKARQELVQAIERERKAGRKMRPSVSLFKKFVYDTVRDDFTWVEVEDDAESDQDAGQAGDSRSDGRDLDAASGERMEAPAQRVMRDAPQKSLSGVSRGRYYTTGPLSRLAAGTGASGGDGE